MSDLDTELHGLRDELNAAIPLPDVDQLTGLARTRRRLQVAAVVVVAVMALVVPLLRWLPSSTQPAAPPGQNTTYVLDFADSQNGYALARACQPGKEGCAFTLYQTEDAGITWTPRTLPAPPNPKTGYFSATMYVLGPDAVAIDRPTESGMERIHTTDGGSSWQTARDWWQQGIPAAPLEQGALLTGECSDQPYQGSMCHVIGTIEPDTGRFVATPAQPPLDPAHLGSVATESDKYWMIGRSIANGRMTLAVSPDAGRTWWTSDLPSSGTPGSWAMAEHNGVMYLTASDSKRLLGVWRSVDGGQLWDARYRWDSAEHESRYVLGSLDGVPIAAGDGTLIVSDGQDTYVSTDQGRTFKPNGEKATGTVVWTRAGYLRSNAGKFALSTGGLRWKVFTVK